MKMKAIEKVFRTSDGALHATEYEAREREVKIGLSIWLAESIKDLPLGFVDRISEATMSKDTDTLYSLMGFGED